MDARLKALERAVAAKQAQQQRRLRDLERQYDDDVAKGLHEPTDISTSLGAPLSKFSAANSPNCSTASTNDLPRTRSPTRTPGDSGDIVIALPSLNGDAINVPPTAATAASSRVGEWRKEDGLEAFMAQLQSNLDITAAQKKVLQRNARSGPARFNGEKLNISFPAVVSLPPMCTPYRHKPSMYRTELPHSIHPAVYKSSNADTRNHDFFISTIHAVPRMGVEPVTSFISPGGVESSNDITPLDSLASTARSLPPTPLHHQQSTARLTPTLPTTTSTSPPPSTVDPTSLSSIEIPLSLTQAELITHIRTIVMNTIPDGTTNPTAAPKKDTTTAAAPVDNESGGGSEPIRLEGGTLPSATLNWYEVLPCTALPYTHIERRKLRLKELMTTAVSTVQQGLSCGWSRQSISSAVVEALRDDLADWKRCADDELIFSPHPPFAAGFASKTVEEGVSKTSGDVLRDVLAQLRHQNEGLFGEKLRHHSGYILRRIPADVKRGITEGTSWEGAHDATQMSGATKELFSNNTSFQCTNVSFSMGSVGGRVWNDVPMSGLIPENGAVIPTISALTGTKANPLPPSAITNIQMLKKAIVVLTWFFVCVSRREQLQLELLVRSRRLCDTPPQYAALLDDEDTLESPKADIANSASMSPTNSALKGQRGTPPEMKKSRGVVMALSGSNLQRPRPSKRNTSTRKTRSATIGVGLVELSAITQEMMLEDGNNSSRTNGSDDSGSESALPIREDNTTLQMAGIRGQIAEYMRMEEAMFNGLGDILGKSLQYTLTGRGDPSVADSKPSTLLTSGFEGRVARDEFLDVIPLLLTYCVRYALAESFPDVDHRHEDDVAEQRDLEREQEAERAKRHRHDTDSKKSMAFKTGKGGLKRRALWVDPRFATTRKAEPVIDAAGVMYFSPPPVCVPEVFGEEDYRGDHQHLAVGASSRAAKAMEGLDTWDQLVYSARNTALTIEFTHRIFRQITMWLTGVDPHMSAVEAAKGAFETQRVLEERLLTKDGVSAHLLSTEEEEYLDGAGGGGMGKRRKSINLSSGGFVSNDNTDKEESRDQRGCGAPTSRKQSDMIAAALLPEAFPHPCMASDQSKVVQFRPTGFDTGGFGGSVDLGTTTPAFMTEFGEEVIVSSNKSSPSAREKALQYDSDRKARRMEQARTLTTTTSKRWEDHSQCRTVVSTRQETGSTVPTWQFQAPAWSVVHADCLLDLMADPLDESGSIHKPVALRQHLVGLFMVPHPIYGYTQNEQEVIANMPAFQDRAETSADVEGQGARVTQKYSAHRSPLVLLYLHRFGPVTTSATVRLPLIPTNRIGSTDKGAKTARHPSVRSIAPPLPPVSSARTFKTSKDGATSVISHNFSSIARQHELRAEKMIEEGVKEFKAFRQRENVILQQTSENRKHRDRLIAYSKAMVQYSRSPRNPEKVRMARKIEVTLKNALRVHTQWCKVGQYLSGHLENLAPTDPFAPPTYECDLNATNDVDAAIIKQLPHYLVTRRPLDKLDVVRALQFACGLYEAEIQTMTCDSLIRDRLTKLWSECAGRRRNLQRDPLMERCDVSKELQAALSPGNALPPQPTTGPTTVSSRQEPLPKDKWALEKPSQNGVICSPPETLKAALNDHQEQVKRDHWSLVQYTQRDNAFQLDLSKTEASAHGDDYLHALSERLVAKTGFQGHSVDTVVIGKLLVEGLESQGRAIDPPPPDHVRTPPRSPTTSTRQGTDAKRFSSSSKAVPAVTRSSIKTDEEPKTVYWERQQAELRQQRALERLKYKHEMDHMNLEVDLFIAQNSGAKKVAVDEDLFDGVDEVLQEEKRSHNPLNLDGELSLLGATGSFDGSSYSPTHGMLLDAINVVSRPQSLLFNNPISPLIPSPPPHGRSPRRPSVPQEFQSTHEQVQRRLDDITTLDKTKRDKKIKEDKSKEVPLLESLLRPEEQHASSFSVSRNSPSVQSPIQLPRSAVSPPRSAVNIDSAVLLKHHVRSEDPSQCRSVEEGFFYDENTVEEQQLHNDDAVVRRESSVRRRSRSSTITDRMVVQSVTLASALKAQQDCLEEVIRSSEPVYEEVGMPPPSAHFEDNEAPPVRSLSGMHQGGSQLPPRPSVPDTREGSRLTTPFKGSRATHPMQRRETPTEDRNPSGGGHMRPSDVTKGALPTDSN